MNEKLFVRLGGLLVFVLFISASVIYLTFDIRALNYLTMFNVSCVALALGSLFLGLMFDGLRLITLANLTDEKLSLKQVTNVVLSNYFLALFTPGASGGAIAQVMFMRRAGVPVAKATVIVLVRTIMSIFFLIVLIPVVLHSDSAIVKWMPASLITILSVFFTSMPVVAYFLMRTNYPEQWLYAGTKNFSHTWRRKSFKLYREFKQAFIIMGRHPMMVARAFLESGLSLLFIYGTVPAYFTGLNLEFDFIQVMGRMVLLNLVLYFSPTPGGSGIAEAGFIVLFSRMLPEGVDGIMAVLWRFTAEYLPFFLGAVVSIRAFGENVLNIVSAREEADNS